MSVSVTVAGVAYTIPQVGEVSWGANVTSWIQAISSNTLQTSGGTLTLTGDLNFGATYGLFAKYFTTISTNAAQSGVLRLSNTDGIGFRNAGASADYTLKPHADGFLQYNSIDLANISSAQTLTNKTFDSTSTLTGVLLASFTPDGSHTLTMPTVTDTLVGLAASQTLTNKTLTAPIISTISNSGTLTLPTGPDTIAGIAASQTLTNKTIAAGSNTISGLTNSNLSGSAAITNANFNTMSANTVKANVTGGSATPTDVALVSAATASAAMIRDANANVAINNLLESGTSTATGGTTTTLTVSSTGFQQFTGSTTQTCVLPAANTLALYQAFYIVNRSTGAVTVNANGGGLVQSMATNTQCWFTCTNIGSGAGTWDVSYSSSSALSNPMTTGGDIIYGGASGTPTRLSNGSQYQFLQSAGGTSAPTWQSFRIPTVQAFTSTGSQTGWLFNVTSWTGTIVAGDTYTNNGHTYTAQQITQTNGGSGYTLFMSGTSATTSSGTDTLTKGTSASGPATITFNGTKNLATATYTTPTGPTPVYLKIKMVGGGAGGGGSGGGGVSSGTAGVGSYFGPNILTANGGLGGASAQSAGGTGGTASLGSAIGVAVSGAPGGGGGGGTGGTAGVPGGAGGNSPYFSGGGSGEGALAGTSGVTNTGGGGAGAGSGLTTTIDSSAGGGSGGFVEALITAPVSTYPYVIGTGGANGAAGSGGFAGGSGAAGQLIVEEHYA